MSERLTHRISRTCLTVVAAAALGASAFSVPAVASDAPTWTSTADVTVVKAKKTVQDLKKFWTPERMKAAKPVPLPAVKGGTSAAQGAMAQTPGDGVASADAVPPQGASANVAGSYSTEAADLSVSQTWDGPTTSWPLNATGKLFFTEPDGTSSECSASVIVSNGKSALWTAGHCIHDGKSGQAGFYKNVAFAPAYNGTAPSPAPWGIWEANNLIVPSAWSNGDSDKELNADFGSVILNAESGYGKIQDAIGAYGYRFGAGSDYSDIVDFGYPADGYNRPDSDFNGGEKLMYCYGNVEDAFNWNPLDNRMSMDCDMGHGASGGPMLSGFPQNIAIVGANSHIDVNDAKERTTDNLYSSEHAARAISVINTVNSL